MSDDRINSLLDQVEPTRRSFLKRMLGGGALALMALPASTLLVQEAAAQDTGKKGKKGAPGDGKKGKKGKKAKKGA